MKNFVKLFGIAAIAAVMLFAMTSCSGDDDDDDDSGDNGGGAVTGISSLVLSGQVYGEDDSQFKGNLNISGVYDWNSDVVNIGTGRITNGVLNYTIGTPSNSLLISYNDLDDGYLFSPNETSSNGNVKFLAFAALKPDSEDFDELFKANINFKSESFSQVFYIYVDGNVTISSERTTTEYDTINAYSLSLKKGWNIGNYRYRSDLIAITLNNPSAKWILDGYIGNVLEIKNETGEEIIGFVINGYYTQNQILELEEEVVRRAIATIYPGESYTWTFTNSGDVTWGFWIGGVLTYGGVVKLENSGKKIVTATQ